MSTSIHRPRPNLGPGLARCTETVKDITPAQLRKLLFRTYALVNEWEQARFWDINSEEATEDIFILQGEDHTLSDSKEYISWEGAAIITDGNGRQKLSLVNASYIVGLGLQRKLYTVLVKAEEHLENLIS